MCKRMKLIRKFSPRDSKLANHRRWRGIFREDDGKDNDRKGCAIFAQATWRETGDSFHRAMEREEAITGAACVDGYGAVAPSSQGGGTFNGG